VSSFYGSNFGCVKILDDALVPSIAAALRFILAALVFSPFVLNVAKSKPALILGGLEVGAYSAVGYWAQAISLQTSQASTAAFICSLAVIVVPLLDSIFEKSKSPSKGSLFQSLLPAILAATGVASLEIGGSILPGVGDLWAFLQPLFFGFAYWRTERFMKIASQPGEAQAFTGSAMSVVAVCSIVWTMADFVTPLLLQQDGNSLLMTALSTQLQAITSDWHVPAALVSHSPVINHVTFIEVCVFFILFNLKIVHTNVTKLNKLNITILHIIHS